MKEKPPHVAGREHFPEDGSSFPEQVGARTIGGGPLAEALDTVRREWKQARRFLDLVAHLIVGLDREGRITMINRAGCRVLGYAEGELLGKEWFATCLPQGVSDEVRRLFAEIVAGTGAIGEYHENPILTRGGGERLIAWHNTVLRDASGRFLGTLSSGEDITERKRAEESIGQLVEELAALNTLSRAVNTTLAMEPTTTAALQGILDAVHPDLVFLFLRDGERLILKDALPSASRARLGVIPEHRVGECICGLAVREKRPIYARDMDNDLRCTWKECKRSGFKSFAALPLISGNEAVGVIGLASDTERDFERQGGFLETLAAQVSIALANARLYEEARQELAERKRAEESLRRSEEKFAKAFQASPIIMVISQLSNRRFIEVNETFEKVTGYTREEAIASTTIDQDIWVNPAERERLLPIFLANGRVRNEEQQFRTKSGEVLTCLFSAELIEVDGEKYGLSVVQNVTEQRQAERALRDSEDRLRLAVAGGGVGLWEWQIATDQLTWNDQLKAIFGLQPEVTGLTLDKFLAAIHPEDMAETERSFRGALENHRGFNREYRIIRPDGTVRWIVAIGHGTYDAASQPVRMVGAALDITERKLSENIIRASHDRLAILSRQLLRVQESERQHLARELHDQIGQTLTAVHLCVQQVRNVCGEAARPRLDECARIVDEAIRRTREVSLNLRPAILDDFGLVPALQWYVDQVRRQTDVEFILDMNLSDCTLPPELSNACFRVVQEAITNVLRHAQARHVWIELRRNDDDIHLSVRDDGVGCNSETVEPARRAGRSIGLVGMQERVELLGGKFDFRSEPGRGTEIRASIPIASGEENEEEPVSDGAAQKTDPT
jgi:two-component system sensor histidine kinase UhpB